MKKLHFAAMFLIPVLIHTQLVTPVMAQSPQTREPVDSPIKRSSALTDKESADLRKDVEEQVRRLETEYEVHRRIQEALARDGDGSSRTSLKNTIILAKMAANRAALFPPAADMIEQYGHRLKADATRSEMLAKTSLLNVERTQKDIDLLADAVVELRRRVSTASEDPNGRRVLESDLADKEDEIKDLIDMRDDQVSYAQRYSEQAAIDRRELSDLTLLDKELQSAARREENYIKRIVAAVDAQADGITRNERSPLRGGLEITLDSILRLPRPVEIQGPPPGIHNGVPTVKPLVEKRLIASPVNNTSVEAELRKAEQRRKEQSTPRTGN